MVPGRLGGDSPGSEPVSGPVEPRTVGRAEHAVIADFDASVRPDVRKKTTHNRFSRAGTAWDLRSGRFRVLKSDVAILQLEEARLADGTSNAIRGKLADGVLATADWRTVNAPVLVPDVRIDLSAQVGFVQVVSALGLEDDGAGRDVDEAVCA